MAVHLGPNRLHPALLLGAAVAAAVAIAAGPARADAPRFQLPIDCVLGTQCTVQNYVDQDPGPGARDYTCGDLTYDGHKGTDFRLPDEAALLTGVPVLAAAAGRVLRTRDEMDDVSVLETGTAAVKDREAGNSVIIDHGGGWVTQYSHMHKGSILVRPEDMVAAGQRLGLVGLSGLTEFPHLHFEVRYLDEPVDPFTGVLPEPRCGVAVEPLWTAPAQAALAYQPSGILGAGFATGRPDERGLQQGRYAATAFPSSSPALVFWVRTFGIKTGDEQTIRLIGPEGKVIAQSSKISEKPLAEAYSYAGAQRQGSAFDPGTYRGEYTLTRAGGAEQKVLLQTSRTAELQ